MHYTRLEMRLLPRGWSRGLLYEYAIQGLVRGVALDVASGTVSHTLVPQGRRAPKVEGAAPVGDAKAVLPAGAVRLTRAVEVMCGATSIGRVSRVWCDSTNAKLTHVIVREEGGPFARGPERVIEATQIADFTAVGLTLTKAVVAASDLPLLRDDELILRDVRLALAERIPDPRARRDIKVRVEDGHVSLVGWVDLVEEVDAAKAALRVVEGIRDVTFDLQAFDVLGVTVSDLIAEFIAQRGWTSARVQVMAEHGIIFLEGNVPTAEARTEIERLVFKVPGIKLVANNIAVAGEPPSHTNGTGPLVRSK